jgi:hypothetical protein
MELSYNEEQNKRNKLRHVFYPDKSAFITESILGVIILIIFNATELSNHLFESNPNTGNPMSYSFGILGNFLNAIQKYYAVQQISLFLLWAAFGALLYILLFRLFQIVLASDTHYTKEKDYTVRKKAREL